MIVVDASVVLQILLDSNKASKLRDTVNHAKRLIAPHFIDLEVLNGFRRHLRIGALSAERALQAIEDMRMLQIDRRPIHGFATQIWSLRDNITPYDAAYVVLASELGVPFLTRDIKLAKAAEAHAKVILI